MSNIQQPGISSPEDKFTPSESNGALLLFFPTAIQSQVKTAHGEADAVACRIVRLNDGRVWENALIFPTALVTQLRGAVPDGIVLGTLGQGENTKGNPPWLLRPYTDAELQQAEAWIAQNPRIPQAPQPSAGGWGAPPTAAAPAPAWDQKPPAAAPAAPATAGWGNQAVTAAPVAPAWNAPAPAAAPNVAAAGWGAPAAPPAPSAVHPGLVEALRKKGVAVPPEATQEAAEGIWAVVQHNPDVA